MSCSGSSNAASSHGLSWSAPSSSEPSWAIACSTRPKSTRSSSRRLSLRRRGARGELAEVDHDDHREDGHQNRVDKQRNDLTAGPKNLLDQGCDRAVPGQRGHHAECSRRQAPKFSEGGSGSLGVAGLVAKWSYRGANGPNSRASPKFSETALVFA